MNTEITQVIVNEYDEIIDHKIRSEITSEDIYRVSALDVRNSNGDILLAQRWFLKKKWPWKRSVAVAGTVDTGESYEDNIYKEAEEEIGLTGYVFQEIDKNRRPDYFSQYYSVIVDKSIDEFILEEWQVANLRWFSIEEIKHLLIHSPWIFLSSLVERLSKEFL